MVNENTQLTPYSSNSPIKIVDEEGKEIVRPDVLNTITQLAEVGQLMRIRKSIEREHIQGRVFPLTLSASEQLGYADLLEEAPFNPFAKASFYNDGPDSVKISINNAADWNELAYKESMEIDLTKADRRIDLIYYKCDTGETASVRVKGKY